MTRRWNAFLFFPLLSFFFPFVLLNVSNERRGRQTRPGRSFARLENLIGTNTLDLRFKKSMKIQGDFFFLFFVDLLYQRCFPSLFLAENLKKDIEKERLII